MDAHTIKLAAVSVTAALGITTFDPAPLAIIALCFLVAVATGAMGAQYAIRVSRQEIVDAFKEHNDKLHDENASKLETALERRKPR